MLGCCCTLRVRALPMRSHILHPAPTWAVTQLHDALQGGGGSARTRVGREPCRWWALVQLWVLWSRWCSSPAPFPAVADAGVCSTCSPTVCSSYVLTVQLKAEGRVAPLHALDAQGEAPVACMPCSLPVKGTALFSCREIKGCH